MGKMAADLIEPPGACPLPPTPLPLAIQGATGRMGTRLIQLVADDPTLALAAAIDRPNHPGVGSDVGPLVGRPALGIPLSSRLDDDSDADVLIDFSTPAATLASVPVCQERKVAMVVGTTGFEPSQRVELEAASERIPLLIAANFSTGVHLLLKLVELAARAVGNRADVEIVEVHHRLKKDAPSGTALRIAEVIERAAGFEEDSRSHGRSGLVGERPRGGVGLHSVRSGDNPGAHTVLFGLPGEEVEIAHRALNRDGFALGALAAAKFLAGRAPGLYSMDDFLRLSPD